MEEKIIDGINIAECEFAIKPINDNRIKCHCVKGLLQISKMQEQPESIKGSLCENNPNCYYKQLKRLEQKNEELKEELASFMNGDYCAKGCKKMNNAFQDAHKCILEESERLYSSQIEEFEESLHNLKQENKQLKKENKELKKENETLNYQWHKQSEIGDEWYKVAEKYKTALEEIRYIANQTIIDYTEIAKNNEKLKALDLRNRMSEIQNIINETGE